MANLNCRTRIWLSNIGAAVMASAPAFRMPDAVHDDVVWYVVATAAPISRDMGFVPVAVGLGGNRS